jgi:hypothetical protein
MKKLVLFSIILVSATTTVAQVGPNRPACEDCVIHATFFSMADCQRALARYRDTLREENRQAYCYYEPAFEAYALVAPAGITP